jgi:hypothetical protein
MKKVKRALKRLAGAAREFFNPRDWIPTIPGPWEKRKKP